MVQNKEYIMDKLKGFIGDKNDDETLRIIENFNDTIDEWTKEKPVDDWEKKYHDLDAEWRQKYKDRFFNKETQEKAEEQEQKQSQPLLPQARDFSELFEKKED
ncbi:MAG: hypothetical protein NC548_34000 [Lachnospiraceae bacterium]|nr:hypothetical protein [Lachnospiraceae bacterium]